MHELSTIPISDHSLSIPGANSLASSERMMALAIEKGASPESLGQILALHERMKASAAKEAFDAALANLQHEMPMIVKSKLGAKSAYKYAPLDEIVQQTREVIRKNGFSYTINGDIEPGWVKATVKITHCAGHSQESSFKAPIDNKNGMMSDPQRYGGAMTFAKRYAFCNAFGIMTADEDLDARDRRTQPGSLHARKPDDDTPPTYDSKQPEQTKQPEPQPQPQQVEDIETVKQRIRVAIKPHFATFAAFQQHCWDEGWISDTTSLAELSLSQLSQLETQLKTLRK